MLSSHLLPQPNRLPKSRDEAKKLLGTLGMEYHVIHCCENGCMLYWREHEHDIVCATCGTGRYRTDCVGEKIPRKVCTLIVFARTMNSKLMKFNLIMYPRTPNEFSVWESVL